MAAPRICDVCGVEPKKKANAHRCVEDWADTRPMQEQIALAEARLVMVPPELRLDRVPAEQWPPGRRWCSGCQTFVRLVDCPANSARCRACKAAGSREYRLGRDFGLTTAEYRALWLAQGGRCWLCGRRSPSRPLAVDHDHDTGEVRGLLCPDPDWGCNLKIVARADSYPDGAIAFAVRMVQYFREPPARKVLDSIRD